MHHGIDHIGILSIQVQIPVGQVVWRGPMTQDVMPVGRALYKITVVKVGLGVINQGYCCMDVLSVTDILGYKQVFIHIQLSFLQVTFSYLHVTDLAVEH